MPEQAAWRSFHLFICFLKDLWLGLKCIVKKKYMYKSKLLDKVEHQLTRIKTNNVILYRQILNLTRISLSARLINIHLLNFLFS